MKSRLKSRPRPGAASPLAGAALLLVGAALACAERYADTPKLVEARTRAGKAAEDGPGRVQTSGPPKELTQGLQGGTLVHKEDFEREALGAGWKAESEGWRIEAGELVNKGADNAGAWWLEKLPEGDVRIEFDARSMPFTTWVRGEKKESFPGDLKCEAFAVEPTHQKGYVFIFGGWSNTRNRIARLEEHGEGEGAWVVDGPSKPVEAGHTYRMKVVRAGSSVGLFADGQYLVHATDTQFIEGRYFGLNNWRSELHFDNVAIYSLAKAPTPPKAEPAAAPLAPKEPPPTENAPP